MESRFEEDKTNFLFIDEVQMCPDFELTVNSLYGSGKYDIYITGSNAFQLSANLATLFTGNLADKFWTCYREQFCRKCQTNSILYQKCTSFSHPMIGEIVRI